MLGDTLSPNNPCGGSRNVSQTREQKGECAEVPARLVKDAYQKHSTRADARWISSLMSCFHPMPAVRMDGSGDISMARRDADRGTPLQLPCGNCVGCRADKTLSWSVRCQHEAKCWDENIVATLTYDPKKLPPLGQLDPVHLQSFIKRLRRFYTGERIRFFAVGEYGDDSSRPHYHALLYNIKPVDWKPYGQYFASDILTEIWGHGNVVLDNLTPQSCSYVAGYALKKIKAADRREVRELIDPATGECAYYVPPFLRMSNRPGIGALWFEKFKSDLLRGYLPHGGKKLKIPRYYADKLKTLYPEQCEELSGSRSLAEMDRVSTDPTYDYRRSDVGREAAETIARAKRALLKPSKPL